MPASPAPLRFVHSFSTTPRVSTRLPRRGLFRAFARHYRLSVRVFVSLIVFLSGFAQAPKLTLFSLAAYIVFTRVLDTLPAPWIGSKHPAAHRELIVPLLLTLGASVLMWWILHSPKGAAPSTADSMWLLYLLPILLISHRGGDTTQVCAVAGFAMLAVLLVTPLDPRSNGTLHLWILSIKWLWLGLLTLVMHTLIRVIGNRSDDLAVLHHLYSQTAAVRTAPDERTVLDPIARDLARVFISEQVNLLETQPNGALKVLGSSADREPWNAREPFEVQPSSQGIVGHVLSTQAPYFANDVRKDVHYKESPYLPNTQSELAVPIQIGTRTIGVLDVQSNHRGTFGEDDVALAVGAARYIGTLLDNLRVAKYYRHVSDMFTSIAGRFLSEDELIPTLQEIAAVANAELEADVVILYVRDPLTNAVRWGASAGIITEPDKIDRDDTRRASIVERLLAAPEDARFDDTVVEEDMGARAVAYRSFVSREGIVSRASLKLVADRGSVGLMFLNYRSQRRFDDDSKARCRMFASAAALAIQKVQTQEQQLLWQREEFERALHDRIKGRAFGISRLLTNALRDSGVSQAPRDILVVAREAAEEMCGQIEELVSARIARPMTDLEEELRRLSRFTEQTYRVQVNIRWPTNPIALPSIVVRELTFVAGEMMANAGKHGATRVMIDASFDKNICTLECSDDGPGFDIEAKSKGRGLRNIRTRIERLRGSVDIVSGSIGTRLSVRVPITSHP